MSSPLNFTSLLSVTCETCMKGVGSLVPPSSDQLIVASWLGLESCESPVHAGILIGLILCMFLLSATALRILECNDHVLSRRWHFYSTPPCSMVLDNSCFLLGFSSWVSLCGPGCLGTISVVQPGLELTKIPLLLPPECWESTTTTQLTIV